ncbi:uncharacterized protein pimreg isoform X2 [Scleropages formosus]|uniref:uncharacterized protein pimreg isoform X2 n=1 Tax=Scleropages formosus TaxID=113540 RepID=UPI000878DD4C|nr:uncharacterized protein LOC108921242 isoform X2 [Scleropages formosus]
MDMTSSVIQAVSGIWRGHTALDESNEVDSSPEVPDRFRKLPSSSSLGSLGASLRKRLPLRTVQVDAEIQPTREILQAQASQRLCLLRCSARNSVSSAYQLQRSCSSQEEFLVASPGQAIQGEENRGPVQSCTPHKPAAVVSPKYISQVASQRAYRAAATLDDQGIAVRPRSSRRRLVRLAALRSPLASPNTLTQQREFNRNLDSVSSGLKKLEHLSQAFDDIIGRDDRIQSMMNYHQIMVRSCREVQNDPACWLTKTSIQSKTKRVQELVSSWSDVALSKVRKAT